MVKTWRDVDKKKLIYYSVCSILAVAVILPCFAIVLMTLTDLLDRNLIFSYDFYSQLAKRMYQVVIGLFILLLGIKKCQ